MAAALLGGMANATTTKGGTIKNNFHNTEIRVRDLDKAFAALETWRGERTPAQKAMARRLHNALCGVKGCACGTVRGPQ